MLVKGATAVIHTALFAAICFATRQLSVLNLCIWIKCYIKDVAILLHWLLYLCFKVNRFGNMEAKKNILYQFLYARLNNGRIMPWQYPPVCPPVRPSVRPSVRVFRTFLQHAMTYQFDTWYIHSVGSTTCRVWVALQLRHFDLVYNQK